MTSQSAPVQSSDNRGSTSRSGRLDISAALIVLLLAVLGFTAWSIYLIARGGAVDESSWQSSIFRVTETLVLTTFGWFFGQYSARQEAARATEQAAEKDKSWRSAETEKLREHARGLALAQAVLSLSAREPPDHLQPDIVMLADVAAKLYPEANRQRSSLEGTAEGDSQ